MVGRCSTSVVIAYPKSSSWMIGSMMAIIRVRRSRVSWMNSLIMIAVRRLRMVHQCDKDVFQRRHDWCDAPNMHAGGGEIGAERLGGRGGVAHERVDGGAVERRLTHQR